MLYTNRTYSKDNFTHFVIESFSFHETTLLLDTKSKASFKSFWAEISNIIKTEGGFANNIMIIE
jgi:hypothetical protein